MKRKLITAAAIALILTACGSDNTEHSETTAAQTTAVSAVQTAASKPKAIKPLSPTKSQSYYQDEVFSVTASLDDLKSSLYYPDIVAKMGVNPEMFAIDITVKVKNISQEEQNFDQSKLELLSGDDVLYIFDSYVEKAENIKSGKTVTLYLKALCTLQQAAEISGMTYVGQPLETGEYFYPDEFADIIDVQSDEDVSSYLYKQYILQNGKGNRMMQCSDPAAIGTYYIGRVGENAEYYAIKYTVTNRSDYALIIDPNMYNAYFAYSREEDFDPDSKAVYISTDEELMYEPKEEGSISGIGTVYALPEFLCMHLNGSTEFTILYSVSGDVTDCLLSCGQHNESPCYAEYESVLIDHFYE